MSCRHCKRKHLIVFDTVGQWLAYCKRCRAIHTSSNDGKTWRAKKDYYTICYRLHNPEELIYLPENYFDAKHD